MTEAEDCAKFMNSKSTPQGLPAVDPGATQWKGANGPRVDPSRLVGYTDRPAVAADAVHEEVGDWIVHACSKPLCGWNAK